MKTVRLLAFAIVSWAWSAESCVLSSECDDANLCNGSETCQAGVCIPGAGITCDDGNPCTVDTCDMTAGCTFTPANGCLLGGKKLKLAIGSRGDLRVGLETAAEMAGVAFPANFTADDPVLNGASIRIFATGGDLFDNTYPLPMGRWEYLGAPGDNKGYRYKDYRSEAGPINIFVIKNGHKSKMKGRSRTDAQPFQQLDFTLNGDPQPVNVVLRMGNTGRLFCLAFGGRTRFTPGARFGAVAALAPASCP